MKNFFDINIATLGKALDVQGVATRRQFWYFVLFNWLAGLGASIIDIFIPGNMLGDVVTILLFIPGVTVTIRRMHDTDHAGWWMLVPIVNLIFLLTPSKPSRWSSTS
jgi:uncharacterized membrane protein YhaH (DUF805 family)